MNIATYIDHTLLKPGATEVEISQLCLEAKTYQFAAVCVPPIYVSQAHRLLAGTAVRVACVVGFPFGYHHISTKVVEIKQAIADGADELDMVMNQAALQNGDFDYLSREIVACLQPVRLHRKSLKVIIESGVLRDEEIIQCCELYAQHKVDFVKTSTGYAAQGATLHAVELMRRHLPDTIAIKASGGIRTFEQAKEFLSAGASRIGTSAGIAICGNT